MNAFNLVPDLSYSCLHTLYRAVSLRQRGFLVLIHNDPTDRLAELVGLDE